MLLRSVKVSPNKTLISPVLTHAYETCINKNNQYALQLELIYYFTYFSTVVPSNSCVFLSCMPIAVDMTFSTGLVGVEV